MKGLIRGIKGTLAVTLCALLAVPAVAGGSAELRATSTDGVRLAASASGSPAAEKEETVYVLAHADGSVRQLIVSDWLKNPEGVASLSDYTELTGVKNVKGDESFEESGEHGLIWAAGGHDIYYQGATEKTLPVDVAIRFTLDGKSVTPEELAGQSGHVTMRFDYDNHTEQTVTISGKSVSMGGALSHAERHDSRQRSFHQYSGYQRQAGQRRQSERGHGFRPARHAGESRH